MNTFAKSKATRSKRKLHSRWEDVFQGKPIKVEDKVESTVNEVSNHQSISLTGEEMAMMDYNEEIEDTDVDRITWSDLEEDVTDQDFITNKYSISQGIENDFEEALNTVASFFIKNNVSRNLGKDIFAISKILKHHPNMKLIHVEKKSVQWGSQDNRVYSFCVKCSTTLSKSKKCGNKGCSRFGVSQANVSSLKTVATFSIRKQMEQLIQNGSFDSTLLTRSTTQTSINTRLCNTPKYKARVKACEEKYPNAITLLLSLNTDGFRKRGCSRGEIWPLFLAAHDISTGEGAFREYRPEVMILSAIMQTNTKLASSDFDSLFHRMCLEIHEMTANPLKIRLNNVEYDVRVELFQSVLDLDASRKIHGLPVWQSYESCSRCTVHGERIKTKTGSVISWFPGTNVTEYTEANIPAKLLRSSLQPPFNDGFDGLHILHEGTSRDLLKDLLGNGRKMGKVIKKRMRLRWSNALNSANTPRGRASSSLVDPIQLSTRTGSEVQQLYDIAIPTLISFFDESLPWLAFIFLHWISTRKVTDWHIELKTCQEIKELNPLLRELTSQYFPTFYTMKFHFLVDHLAPNIAFNGSPLLSSASPYERLNQTMGRSSTAYTTRTLMNIASKFLAFKEASKRCPPKKSTNPIVVREDKLPLTEAEKSALLQMFFDVESFKLTWFHEEKVYSVRRCCQEKTIHNNYIYYYQKNQRIAFGSIERIFELEGNCFALIQQFKTTDPFRFVYDWLVTNFKLNVNSRMFNDMNPYYRKIVGSDYAVVECQRIEGFVTILEFEGNSYVSRC